MRCLGTAKTPKIRLFYPTMQSVPRGVKQASLDFFEQNQPFSEYENVQPLPSESRLINQIRDIYYQKKATRDAGTVKSTAILEKLLVSDEKLSNDIEGLKDLLNKALHKIDMLESVNSELRDKIADQTLNSARY